MIMAAATIVIGIILGIVVGPAYFLLILAALPTIALSRVRVDINSEELKMSFGPIGWPTKRIPTADLVSADAIDLAPMQWGGWGYRWLPGRTAVVLRKGPAIAVEKADGKLFAVTVGDASTGAEVLRDHLN